MNSEKLKRIMDECGFVIEPLNSAVTMKEVEFLCGQIVKECIDCIKVWRDCDNREMLNDYFAGYTAGCDDSIVEIQQRFL